MFLFYLHFHCMFGLQIVKSLLVGVMPFDMILKLAKVLVGDFFNPSSI